MMRASFLILAICACSFTAHSVEPAYTGSFGNAEEPALRPYKWVWQGTKSLFYHTGNSFVRGNMNRPILGSPEVLRGVRRGTVNFGESVFNGLVFAPIPMKNEYKDFGKINQVLERDMLLRNTSDLAFSGGYFISIKSNDWAPWDDDEIVQRRLDKAKQIRADRKAAQEAREAAREKEPQTRVERAQRAYLGAPENEKSSKKDEGRGNLLRLAR